MPATSTPPPLRVLARGEAPYPAHVAALLGAKAPELLHCLGNLDLLSRPGVGFCGSRKASEQGLAVAADCATQLAAAGFVAVSGYAAGVDMAAHVSALRAGGATLIVLPEGIDHFRVKKDIQPVWDWDRVLVISPFPPPAVWKSYRAMERNGLIIALSRAMVVIEAGAKGGTLNAGVTSLKMKVPLYVVEYGERRDSAAGNRELLLSGGRPLMKSHRSGAANLDQLVQNARLPLTVAQAVPCHLPV